MKKVYRTIIMILIILILSSYLGYIYLYKYIKK